MKLSPLVRFMTNSTLRALSQRHIEAPLLRKMATRKSYPFCLEIGCGRGVGAEIILRQFGAEKVIAGDIDPEQIERAKKGLRSELKDRIEFRVEDAMALDEPDETFDAVFSFGVIHHTEDWRKAVQEVGRVLKPGGEFFFMEPLRPIVRLFTGYRLLRALFAPVEGGMFDLAEFEDALGKAGMEIIGLRCIGNMLILGVAAKRQGH